MIYIAFYISGILNLILCFGCYQLAKALMISEKQIKEASEIMDKTIEEIKRRKRNENKIT